MVFFKPHIIIICTIDLISNTSEISHILNCISILSANVVLFDTVRIQFRNLKYIYRKVASVFYQSLQERKSRCSDVFSIHIERKQKSTTGIIKHKTDISSNFYPLIGVVTTKRTYFKI